MDKTPWEVIDLMTTLSLGRYASEIEGHDDNRGKAILVRYKPRKRKVSVKKND